LEELHCYGVKPDIISDLPKLVSDVFF
jgi:hypothetical protein